MTQEIVFTRGVPPLEAIPRDELLDCFTAAIRDDPTALQYGKLPLYPGHPELRARIAARHGATADEVLVGNGSLQLLDLLAVQMLGPADTVLVEQPSYDRAVQIFRRRGARVVGVPLDEHGIDLDRLEAAVETYAPKLVYLIPDFQNPAGVTLSEPRRRAVVALAERHDFRVVEDVPYRELRYVGTEPPLLRTFGAEHVVTMGSFSKTISPGVRVGFLIAEPGLVRALTRVAEDTYLSPVVVTQSAVAKYLERNLLEPNVARLKALYKPRWEAMIGAIRTLPVSRAFVPQGGFFVSLFFDESANTDDLVRRARERGLVLSPGEPFFAGSDGSAPVDPQKFLRIAFQAIPPDQIGEGIRRLDELLRA